MELSKLESFVFAWHQNSRAWEIRHIGDRMLSKFKQVTKHDVIVCKQINVKNAVLFKQE